jgi:hypothetical protein
MANSYHYFFEQTKKVKGTIVAMIAGTKANGYIIIEKSLKQRNKVLK